ncbi:hypothetical protein N7520_008654 [Penicillium odoratum]|uniref:uncharacterized protein n=1 Tax=Penicillium odoratum TaxID=1167516 RepID=UPI0025489836|nr:uncharacterized protein N7520_008654 [Penicillium odoratum]KAJ5751737.1 hypothetical protein N7520_008654 [Penicillium odoratum]
MSTASTMSGTMPTGMMPLSSMPTGISAMPSMPGFLARSWHIRSTGAFAGSCICVIFLVMILESLRRAGRIYEAFILRRARLRHLHLSGLSSTIPARQGVKARFQSIITSTKTNAGNPSNDDLITPVMGNSSRVKASDESNGTHSGTISGVNEIPPQTGLANFHPYRPSPIEQIVRALLHTMQFAVAYIVMLLAMYYNGYIIICIFIGAFLGSLIFSWEPVTLAKE